MAERCIDGLWKPKELSFLKTWFETRATDKDVTRTRKGWIYKGVGISELIFLRVAIEEGQFVCTKETDRHYCVRDKSGWCHKYEIPDELMEEV